ncbi:MAG: ABC transporter ATP-binding protein, partial [Bacillota bacterium]
AVSGRTVVDSRTFVQPERRGVGMVFQDYGLFPHLTVAENVEFGLHRLSRQQRRARVKEMFELVHLEGYGERYPHELSGGQQQRVALARALAPQPSVLLMDEPFSNLDAALKQSIRDELREILSRAKMTCLLVTHDQQDVEAICDRTIVLT